MGDVEEAEARWRRFAPLLARLYPAESPNGVVESPLLPLADFAKENLSPAAPRSVASRVYLKADHALPIGGSIKARGGVYEVLCIAERVAESEGVFRDLKDNRARLADPEIVRLFSAHRVLVASTGNLGYAVGVMARRLGFETHVFMSHDAKEWKKARLRGLGARVIEHPGDYTGAVAAARESAASDNNSHFIDDERSTDLFLGYATAALRLRAQLREAGIEVGPDRPLCLYLPCGVGGAPGGLLFGARCLFGDAVWGFFAEPVAAPSMLVRLLGCLPPSASVYDAGLDNRTIADGLAVARASEWVAQLVGPHVTGLFTVADAELLHWMRRARESLRITLEPSAAAGFAGPMRWIWESPTFVAERERLAGATHVVWATGGGSMPQAVFDAAFSEAR